MQNWMRTAVAAGACALAACSTGGGMSSAGGTVATGTGTGVPAAGGSSVMPMPGPAMNASSDAHVMAVKHESNLGEIEAGRLAQQRAQNAEVKAFAEKMINEHTTMDNRGNGVALQNGIVPVLPDSALPRMHAMEIRQLRAQSGAAFDRAYVQQQVAAHARTLAFIDAAMQVAQREPVRAVLTEARPAVAMHLQEAQALLGRL